MPIADAEPSPFTPSRTPRTAGALSQSPRLSKVPAISAEQPAWLWHLCYRQFRPCRCLAGPRHLIPQRPAARFAAMSSAESSSPAPCGVKQTHLAFEKDRAGRRWADASMRVGLPPSPRHGSSRYPGLSRSSSFSDFQVGAPSGVPQIGFPLGGLCGLGWWLGDLNHLLSRNGKACPKPNRAGGTRMGTEAMLHLLPGNHCPRPCKAGRLACRVMAC